MYFIGLMSGTSMDAVDAVLTDISDEALRIHTYQQYPIPDKLKSRIRNANSDISIHEGSELDHAMGELFASTVIKLMDAAGVSESDVVAIGSHGQTLLHLPQGANPRTLQIGDPSIIAKRTGITTVADFRRGDMAVGGQGAPLAPLFHRWQFRSPEQDRIVLNLGGMANLTILSSDANIAVSGFDTGPGNALMDSWIQNHQKKEFDPRGQWASSGKVDEKLLKSFLSDPYFALPPPKSTGKDHFNITWLNKILDDLRLSLTPQDIQMTLLELTAKTINDAIEQFAPTTREILVCGGGIHNTQLIERLQELNKNRQLNSTEMYGIHPDAVEAVLFAWLAYRRLNKQTGNLPSVTGAEKEVILGGVYAGS